MDIEVEIEGVSDRVIADAIRKKVRIVRHQFAESGEWRVTIAPSETRGEWDLGIHAPTGLHLVSLTESVDRLPDVIERTLRQRLAIPASV